jgi:hypothetical protein
MSARGQGQRLVDFNIAGSHLSSQRDVQRDVRRAWRSTSGRSSRSLCAAQRFTSPAAVAAAHIYRTPTAA